MARIEAATTMASTTTATAGVTASRPKARVLTVSAKTAAISATARPTTKV